MDSLNTSPREEWGKLLPRCLVCGEVPAGGIRDGLKLKKGFICTGCERKIVDMQPGSTDYDDIVEKLKGILTQ